MENEFFKCYRLFHDIGKELPSEIQAKYYVALMEYGLDGIEPTDPVIKSLLQGPIYSINKSNEMRLKHSIGGKKHSGNQYTKGDTKREAQKKTVELYGTVLEDNGTIVEDNGRKKKKEDIEDIKENILKEKKVYLENVLLSDTEYDKLVKQYGKGIIEQYILQLSDYMIRTGKKYTDHYRTILKRLAKANVKKIEEQAGEKPYDFSKDKIILPVRKREWEIQK